MKHQWSAMLCSFVLVCAVDVVVLAATTSSTSSRPNIVFVIADDLGWADVAFHGGNAPTPHLDRLASEGLELTQHYVAPVCSPTRAGLLTGRCWSRFGVTTPTNDRALPWDTVTLATALRQQDYDTCLIGKWHLGSNPQWGPNRFGFDHTYGSLAGGVSPWNHRYKKGVFSKTWHRNGKLLEEKGHVTDLLTNAGTGSEVGRRKPRADPVRRRTASRKSHLHRGTAMAVKITASGRLEAGRKRNEIKTDRRTVQHRRRSDRKVKPREPGAQTS